MMTVGYFGIPGRTGGQTHLVNEKEKPVCGQRLHPLSVYQWCSHWDNIVPECKKCRKVYNRMWLERQQKNKEYARKASLLTV